MSNRFSRAMATRRGIRSARMTEDAQQAEQGDDADLDEQDDGLGVVHKDGSTQPNP